MNTRLRGTTASRRRVSDLVAFWDFTEAAPPYVAKQGHSQFALANGSGATVTSVSDGPFGGGISLDGTTDYLVLPSNSVGGLNLAQFGDQCTVAAWVSRTDLDQGFVGGMWQEDNGDARRQYALFLDLPAYGGDDQVCGHVSTTGGPTPGYPFSRDYSASARKVNNTGGYRFVAFTYNGSQVISYLDGLADYRPTFTDSQGQTYAKNPYVFNTGLNRTTALSDFTVGACKLSTGMGNFLTGKIGGLQVYRKALTPQQIMDLHRSVAGAGPLVTFDFWTTSTVATQNATDFGWRSARGATAIDTSAGGTANNFQIAYVSGNVFLYRSAVGDATNSSTAGIGYYPTFAGMQASDVGSFTFRLNNSVAADQVRLVIRIGTTWYASNTAYSVTGDGRTGADWSTAETKTHTMSLAANQWRALTFTEGAELTLGSTIATAVPDGDLTAVGFYSPSCTGVVRIDDIKVFD